LVFRTSPQVVLASAVLLLATPLNCQAKTTQPFMVFPPADCSANELRVIAWRDGASSTQCATGQQILKLALPGCKAGQHIEFNGNDFVCSGASVPKEKAAK
jgi:hypothetical protein